MVGAGIVAPLAVGEQHAELRTQLEELIPVAVVAAQARSTEAREKAGVAEPDRCRCPRGRSPRR